MGKTLTVVFYVSFGVSDSSEKEQTASYPLEAEKDLCLFYEALRKRFKEAWGKVCLERDRYQPTL